MADIEDMLLGDDEENPGTPDNAAFAKMRKELKALQREADELRAFKAQAEQKAREGELANVFQQIGLKPRHAKFYPADAETTPEAIQQWAISEEFITVDAEAGGQETTVSVTSPQAGFTPTILTEGATPAMKRYTREEFEQIMRENPERGRALAEAGKVKWNNL